MHIEIQRKSETSLSKQIFQSIVDHIRSGLLREGSQLPSVRELSKKLEVSFVTVVKAYKELEKENFIISIQGKGTFVNIDESDVSNSKTDEPPFNWQLSIQDYLPRAQFSRFHHVQGEIQLSSSMIDPGLLPNQYLEKEIHKMLSENPRILSRYSEIQGEYKLREAMSNYLKQFDVPTTPENLLVTNGSQQGIDLIARTFIGPNDVVIMESPTYPGAIDIFRGRGATILTVPVDSDGMNLNILQNLCDKYKPKIIYTIPTFHNPTGVVMSHKRRRQILEIAKSIQCIIVEDDPWSEIYFDKKPPAPIKSMDNYGHVIYLKGLSKTLAPSCRIGILSASGSIFNRLLAAKSNADLGSPLLTQKSLLPFITSKKMIDHMKKLRTALKVRRDLSLELLSQYSPDGITWMVPKGGLNIWITLPNWMDTNQLLIEAKKNLVSFLPGSACFPVEHEKCHLRLSFSFMSELQLQQGIKTLCMIFNAEISSKKNNSPYF
ncbi:PLP-dependent aminotransferase family protein [Lysinibacillus sphaericus]|uniref:PLP-dependent aminotransferase family protein n=1 Tax=Lysinibacillus sphaericus TaxID=1421 RepID=A0A544UQE7_LYSSH|nr:PLP-dependent aminotransferase family protein [Lysinibacillus sp. SDF0037]TQR36066.1 PLP-dependent aminotransferase family protein [Lysinibacillus sp. SDF0037]